MKKRIFLVFILSFVLIQFANAYEEKQPFFLEFEYFSPSNITDGEIYSLNSAITDGVITSYKMTTPTGFGLKLGYLYAIKSNLDIGISGGYILGPKSEINATNFIDYDREVTFIRVLGELKMEMPMGEYWKFKPGISAGMAFGKVEYTSLFSIFHSGTSSEETWSGFAWEISAPFIYKNYIFSFKYAGFPKVEENNNTNKIEWNTFGFSVGWQFGKSKDTSSDKSYTSRNNYNEPSQAQKIFKQSPAEDQYLSNDIEEEETYIPDDSYETYVKQAKDYLSQEYYMKAAEKYNNALILLPNNDKRLIYIFERQGTVLGKQEKFQQAIKFYMTAIKTGKRLNIVDRNVVNAYLGPQSLITAFVTKFNSISCNAFDIS